MMKTGIKISLIIFICFIFCSCGDYRETNEGLTVSVVGFDKDISGITVSAQTVIPDTEGNMKCELLSAKTESFEEAFSALSKKAVKPLILEHCSAVALSQSLNPADIEQIFLLLGSRKDINLSLYVFCCENSKALIKASNDYRKGGYEIAELIEHNSENQTNKLYKINSELIRSNQIRLPFIEDSKVRPQIIKSVGKKVKTNEE